ncbi:uncharacterized protein LOC121602304 [Anopheles merus]|uniref:uncharacterized protein LOC121602304 n=1 Tax=Anopheles merus TaxID=30066 RepID=UPI001BE3EAFF|nr:uncharacterized protein LOC121602304 [Anopheles merus]
MSALDTRFSYAAGFVKSTTQQHASTGRVSARQNEPFNKNPPFRCTGFGRSGTSSNRRRSSRKNASHRDVKKQSKPSPFSGCQKGSRCQMSPKNKPSRTTVFSLPQQKS